jgi:hypothetical protein
LQAGVDAFDVSLPLVLEVLPDLRREQQEPLAWMRAFGRELGLIRPSSRRVLVIPEVPPALLLLPPADLPQERAARSHSYGSGTATSQPNVTASKTATAKKRAQKQAARSPVPASSQPEESRQSQQESKNHENQHFLLPDKESGRKQQKKCEMQILTQEALPLFSGYPLSILNLVGGNGDECCPYHGSLLPAKL